jgi:hypothetical protein
MEILKKEMGIMRVKIIKNSFWSGLSGRALA